MRPISPGCRHEGFHSGQARYRADLGRLRYVVICDDCLGEVREIAALDYRPEYRASGRPEPAAAA